MYQQIKITTLCDKSESLQSVSVENINEDLIESDRIAFNRLDS